MKKIEMASRKVSYKPPEVEVVRIVTEGVMTTSVIIQVNEIDWEDGGEISNSEGDTWF